MLDYSTKKYRQDMCPNAKNSNTSADGEHIHLDGMRSTIAHLLYTLSSKITPKPITRILEFIFPLQSLWTGSKLKMVLSALK